MYVCILKPVLQRESEEGIERERVRKKYFLSTGSLLMWLQSPGRHQEQFSTSFKMYQQA